MSSTANKAWLAPRSTSCRRSFGEVNRSWARWRIDTAVTCLVVHATRARRVLRVESPEGLVAEPPSGPDGYRSVF